MDTCPVLATDNAYHGKNLSVDQRMDTYLCNSVQLIRSPLLNRDYDGYFRVTWFVNENRKESSLARTQNGSFLGPALRAYPSEISGGGTHFLFSPLSFDIPLDFRIIAMRS